jgi:hypothetical protein
MLHLVPDFAPDFEPTPHPEPIARLASLRNALRVVDDFGGGPASDFEDDDQLTARWESAGEAAKRCFDRRSAELVGVATAGLELIAERQQEGGKTNPAAKQVIADELRGGFEQLRKLLR